MKKINLILTIVMLAVISCQQSKPQQSASEEPSSLSLTKIWETDTLLHTPESVIYDEFRDVLYVANIGNTPPSNPDLDGFISILSTSGEVLNRKWVTGISSSKGMGIIDSSLFVTDINTLVEIDIPSAKIINTFKLEGAGFLNDITIGPDNVVYVSDSDNNSIYQLKNGESEIIHADSTIRRINGLLFRDDKIIVAGFHSGNIYSFDPKSLTKTIIADSVFKADGINAIGDDLIISCWIGKIYLVKPDGSISVLIDLEEDKRGTADAWYIDSINTLFVPTFFGNTVIAYKVE
ncbi:MAG: hypothetical protein JXR07_13345 [Reichenbachiella sp.]